jgi:hypothetical protein
MIKNPKFPYEYTFNGIESGEYMVGFYLGKNILNQENMDLGSIVPNIFNLFFKSIYGIYQDELGKLGIVNVKTCDDVYGIDIILQESNALNMINSNSEEGNHSISGQVICNQDVSDNDVLRGYLLDGPDPSKDKTLYSINISNPKFPQEFIFSKITDGEFYIFFVFDINGDYFLIPGDEDFIGMYLDSNFKPNSVILDESDDGVSEINLILPISYGEYKALNGN